MALKQGKVYFLNWELIPSSDDLLDATQGNELIEIYIRDVDGCRPIIRYTLPIVQAGQSFALIRANLLFPKDICSKPLRHLFINIRILRGVERRLIYTNDYTLIAPYYANSGVLRIPIYRVWYWEDYLRMAFFKLMP